MSLQPPAANWSPADQAWVDLFVGQVWVDPITADRFEWDGEQWVCLGSNAAWNNAEKTKPGESPRHGNTT